MRTNRSLYLELDEVSLQRTHDAASLGERNVSPSKRHQMEMRVGQSNFEDKHYPGFRGSGVSPTRGVSGRYRESEHAGVSGRRSKEGNPLLRGPSPDRRGVSGRHREMAPRGGGLLSGRGSPVKDHRGPSPYLDQYPQPHLLPEMPHHLSQHSSATKGAHGFSEWRGKRLQLQHSSMPQPISTSVSHLPNLSRGVPQQQPGYNTMGGYSTVKKKRASLHSERTGGGGFAYAHLHRGSRSHRGPEFHMWSNLFGVNLTPLTQPSPALCELPYSRSNSVPLPATPKLPGLEAVPLTPDLPPPVVEEEAVPEDVVEEAKPATRKLQFNKLKATKALRASIIMKKLTELNQVTEFGISLKSLEKIRGFLEDKFGDEFETVTTARVVEEWIKPRTKKWHCRLAEMEVMVPPDQRGIPHFLVSHSWQAPVRTLLDTVRSCLGSGGSGGAEDNSAASEDPTRVWVDIFAVNQHTHADGAPHNLNARDILGFDDVGRICSGGTIVAFDSSKSAFNPALRTWCLYEWERTIRNHGVERLQLGCETAAERVALVSNIDLETSKCTSRDDSNRLKPALISDHENVKRFNSVLKLQLLLTPGSDAALITKLEEWGRGTHWTWGVLERWLGSETRVLCVESGVGTGKSCLAGAVIAKLDKKGKKADVIIAAHMLKHSDERRLDTLGIIKKIAFQLALRHEGIMDYLLSLDMEEVASLVDEEEAFQILLREPMDLPPHPGCPHQVIIILDGLEEADPPEAQLQLDGSLSCPVAAGNASLQLLKLRLSSLPSRVRFVLTTRPEAAGGQIHEALIRIFNDSVDFVGPEVFRKKKSGQPEKRSLLLYRQVVKGCGVDTSKWNVPEPDLFDVHVAFEEVFRIGLENLPNRARQDVVLRMIDVILTAPTPPTSCLLAQLGFQNLNELPGWGTTFYQSDEGVVDTIHQCLREWLVTRNPSNSRTRTWGTNLSQGHLMHAQHLVRNLSSSATHVHQHLLRHLSHMDAGKGRDKLLNQLCTDLQWLASLVKSGQARSTVETLGRLAVHKKHTAVSEGLWRWLNFDLRNIQSELERNPGRDAVQLFLDRASVVCPPKSALIRSLQDAYPDYFLIKCSRLVGRLPTCSDTDWSENLLMIESESGPILAVALNRDTSQIVTGSEGNTLSVWDTESSTSRLVLEGHTSGPDGEAVRSVCYSEDGQKIVSGGDDGTVRMWDILTGDCQVIFKGHTGPVTGVMLGSGSKELVSGSRDRTVRIWDVAARDTRCILKGHSKAVTCVFIRFKLVLSGSEDSTVRMWDLKSQQSIKVLQDLINPSKVLSLNATKKTIISGYADHSIRIWDILHGDCQHTLSEHTSPVHSVVCNETHIFSGSEDGEIIVWDLKTSSSVKVLKAHSETVHSLAVSQDGNRLVSGSGGSFGADHTIRLWDVSSISRPRPTVPVPHTAPVTAAAAISSTRLLTASLDGALAIWDTQTSSNIQILQEPSSTASPAMTLCASRSAGHVVSGHEDGNVVVWDYLTSDKAKVKAKILEGHSGPVSALCATHFNLYSAGEDSDIRVWTIESLQLVHTLQGHTGAVTCLCSGKSHLFSGSKDKTIGVWALEGGAMLTSLTGHTEAVTVVSCCAAEKYVVSGGRDRDLRLWLIGSWDCLRHIKSHRR